MGEEGAREYDPTLIFRHLCSLHQAELSGCN